MLTAPSGLRVDKQAGHVISGSVKQTTDGLVEEVPVPKKIISLTFPEDIL